MSKILIDQFARHINYLRLSVTDRCDFRCVYCMSENMTFLPRRDLLTLEELDFVCTNFINLGIEKLRITGGEPLVRKNIMQFLTSISRHLITGKLKELTLTTNGSQLERFASPLADIGVKRINISLDTLDRDKFKKITRWGNLDQVMKGIFASKRNGLRVKINVVALQNMNDDEIHDFVSWCGDVGLDLTFIEVMPMGELNAQSRLDQYWSMSDLKKELASKWTLKDIPLKTGGPARYVEIQETNGRVGFITPLSNNFCESCNRVRLTCTGQLFTCLGQDDEADLRKVIRQSPGNIEILQKKIKRAIARKPKGHAFDYSKQKVEGQMERFMSHTGG